MRSDADRPILLLASMALVVIAIIASMAALDPGVRRSVADILGYGGPHSDDASGTRTLYHSGVPIGGEKGGETYAAYLARREKKWTDGFGGFACPGSCAGHEAGYRWAEAWRLTHPRQCGGTTWDFVEGCAAYVLGQTDS